MIILITFSKIFAFAQVEVKNSNSFDNINIIQIELLGHGLYYSLDYERIIFNRDRFKSSAQIGCSYFQPGERTREFRIPLILNGIISFNMHHIELGVGYVITHRTVLMENNQIDSKLWDRLTAGRIGYRYQKPSGHLAVRIGFTPYFGYGPYNWIYPLGGVAIGYGF
jgi:hypothetical protein